MGDLVVTQNITVDGAIDSEGGSCSPPKQPQLSPTSLKRWPSSETAPGLYFAGGRVLADPMRRVPRR